MKKFRLLAFALVTVTTFGLVAVTPMASAKDLFGYVCTSDGTGDNAACADHATNSNPVVTTINKAVGLVAFAAGVAAIIVIIISGIHMMTAMGDTSSVAKARNALLQAAIGLVVIALSREIIGYVLSKL